MTSGASSFLNLKGPNFTFPPYALYLNPTPKPASVDQPPGAQDPCHIKNPHTHTNTAQQPSQGLTVSDDVPQDLQVTAVGVSEFPFSGDTCANRLSIIHQPSRLHRVGDSNERGDESGGGSCSSSLPGTDAKQAASKTSTTRVIPLERAIVRSSFLR